MPVGKRRLESSWQLDKGRVAALRCNYKWQTAGVAPFWNIELDCPTLEGAMRIVGTRLQLETVIVSVAHERSTTWCYTMAAELMVS